MMNKKYLMRGFAALALVAGFASCVKDVEGLTPAQEEAEAKENAELMLGLNIPDGQTWEMSTQISANVTVNLDASETYTVGICDKNPLNYEDAKFYAFQSADGGYMSTAFTAPAGKKDYYVVAYNSKYQAIVNKVEASNGVIDANVSYTSGASGTMRGTSNRAIVPSHNFTADIPSKPTTTEMAKIVNSIPSTIPSYAQHCKDISVGWQYTPDEFSSGDCYINSSHTGKVKINNGNSKLYVEGNCDMTNGRDYYLGSNMEIYLTQNATFTVPSGFQGGTKVYMASGSSLIVKSGVSTGDICYYSNGGSITVKGNLIINAQKELFMEGGNFTVEGLFQMQPANVYLHNTDVEISGKIDVNHGWDNNTSSNISALYYQEGGSFNETGHELVCNSGIFYTTVDTKFTSIEANGTGIIVNKAGTMTSTGNIRVTNNNSVLINDGDLVGAYLGTEGSAHFQNNGTATISGMTLVNSNNNTWVNNGTYQTEYFNYNAGSSDVINNCRMIVKEDFNINLGDNPGTSCFKMDANASVKTKNFNGGGNFTYTYYRADGNKYVEASHSGGPFYIYMGASSMFEVTETATMNATKANYGIYGPEESDYAVFKAKNIVAGKANQGFEVTYGNNLAVVCDTHFAQGNDGQADHPFIDFKGNATIYQGSNMPGIPEIPATECNPGFKPGPGPKPIPEAVPYTFAFEDQIYNGDYDLNDVVLKITPHANRENGKIIAFDNNQLDVKLVAAGATFNINAYVGRGENKVALFDGKEIHAAFGDPQITSGVMVNTGNGKAKTATPVTCTITTPNDIKSTVDGKTVLDFSKLDIWIWVNKDSGKQSETKIFYLVENAEEEDEDGNIIKKVAPYSIMIPTDWSWPLERECITNAYPGAPTSTEGVYNKDYSFAKWAETPNGQRTDAMKEWFMHPVGGLTMTNASTNSNN